jgi:membrane protein implicated in regulation of membrane protease activity
MLKKTWGEQLIGNFSFAFIFLLLALPGVFFLVLGITANNLPLIVVSVLYFIAMSLAQSALQGIFQAALYLYMRDGEAPEGFEAGELQASIGHR